MFSFEQTAQAWPANFIGVREHVFEMKLRWMLWTFWVIAALVVLPLLASAQSAADSKDSSGTAARTASGQIDLTYVRPTQRPMGINYVFDAFGPYPIVGAAFGAGINQANNTPPEWNQGGEGYGKRFGSNYGIAMVAATTRYGLSEAFTEDAMYCRCECGGIFPRVRYALVSTLTARRGEDGHRAFLFPHSISRCIDFRMQLERLSLCLTWLPSYPNAECPH
jgi:hypothetical protein